MGNTLFNSNNKKVTDLDIVHTIDEFERIVSSNRLELHNQMIKEAKGFKFFITRRTCEYDETDPDIIEDYQQDYILSQYKHQYYIGEITFDQTKEWPAVGNIIWQDWNSIMSYSFNVYCLHRNFQKFKSCVVLKYYTPDRNQRTRKSKYHMSDDLIGICNFVKTLDAISIEAKQLDELQSPKKRAQYEKLNLSQIGIYDEMYESETHGNRDTWVNEESKYEPGLIL